MPPPAAPTRRALRSTCLASATVCSPKWKIEAASTASAPPSSTPSTRCSSVPTPPLAMTGTSTTSLTARVSARSKPSRVPSRSIEVSMISPAPSRTASSTHAIASIPVAVRPPWTKTSRRLRHRCGSGIDGAHARTGRRTRSRSAVMSSGRSTAAVLTDTLSAPARSSARRRRGSDPAADGEGDEDCLGRPP